MPASVSWCGADRPFRQGGGGPDALLIFPMAAARRSERSVLSPSAGHQIRVSGKNSVPCFQMPGSYLLGRHVSQTCRQNFPLFACTAQQAGPAAERHRLLRRICSWSCAAEEDGMLPPRKNVIAPCRKGAAPVLRMMFRSSRQRGRMCRSCCPGTGKRLLTASCGGR